MNAASNDASPNAPLADASSANAAASSSAPSSAAPHSPASEPLSPFAHPPDPPPPPDGPSVDKLADLRVNHLKMVQTATARMASLAANQKNYCVTIVSAAFGLAVTTKHPSAALLALAAIAGFAMLDTKYLKTEQQYWGLYNLIRTQDWTTLTSFELQPSPEMEVPFWQVFRGWYVIGFYAPLTVLVFLVVATLTRVYGGFS